MNIDEAAGATRKFWPAPARTRYAIWHFEGAEFPKVLDRRRFNTLEEAQAVCDRLNLLAVLDALREPSKLMVSAGEFGTYGDPADMWAAMIDAAIKEVEAHD